MDGSAILDLEHCSLYQAAQEVPTYDTALQTIAWATQQDLLLFDGFLGRHFLLGLCVAATLRIGVEIEENK